MNFNSFLQNLHYLTLGKLWWFPTMSSLAVSFGPGITGMHSTKVHERVLVNVQHNWNANGQIDKETLKQMHLFF